MAETRRYIIAKDRRFVCLATNQKKILAALHHLHEEDDLHLLMEFRGEKTFLPLTGARLNKMSQSKSRILVFTGADIETGEDDEPCVATFSIQETNLNVIVDEQGQPTHNL